jgi:hypothetical protein
MYRKRRTQVRNGKRNRQLELAVSSGDVFRLASALLVALKPKKMSVKEIIIIMALAIALLSVVFVVISVLRGDK